MLVLPLLVYWIVLGEFLCLSEPRFPSPRMGTEIVPWFCPRNDADWIQEYL